MKNHVDVLILCGGQGTRLRSVVGASQKVMASVGDRPFLEIIVDHLVQQGFKHLILSRGYQAHDVTIESRPGLTIETSDEKEPLGTGGAVAFARTLVKSNPFFVLNGDSFCAIDFQQCLDFHMKNKALATVVVSKVDDASDYGTVEVEGDRLKSFQEKTKSKSGFVNAGIYCLDRAVLDDITQPSSIEKDIFPKLIQKYKDRIRAFRTDEQFIDIGTPERYKQAQKLLRRK
jgi:D-glycero-alpha-D-manno-heptose 1-phosphate guanylyltransferase